MGVRVPRPQDAPRLSRRGQSVLRQSVLRQSALRQAVLWRGLRVVMLVLILLGQAAAQPSEDPALPSDSAARADESAEPTAPELDQRDARARRHWQSGMAYLEEGEPTSALAAFNKAYQLSPRPEILLSIAVAHEQRGDLSRAITTLRNYLARKPETPKADEVRSRIAELQTKYNTELAALRRARQRDATSASTVQSQTHPASDPSTRLTVAPVPPSRQRAVVMWTSLAVGSASAAGALALGLAAKREYNELENRCGGHCPATETLHGRSLALSSTLLTGLAALGVGVGTWLAVTAPEQSTEDVGWVPQLKVAASPWGSQSHVRWGF